MGLSGLKTGLQKYTLQGKMGKSSCFKLKPISQTVLKRLIQVLLALGLMEMYIDTVNLIFPS